MRSSIFSSDDDLDWMGMRIQLTPRRPKRLRIAGTFALAGLLVALTAARRGPDDHVGLQLDVFWANKLDWKGAADCVIAGDSRACRCVAPPVLADRDEFARVLNFAFDSIGYSAAYLEAIERVVDPEARRRTIVLAITPYSLTPAAVRNNEFEFRRRWLPGQSRAGMYARQSLRFLRPMRVDDLPSLVRGGRDEARSTDYECRTDGWLAMDRLGGNTTMYVAQYERALRENAVDDDVVIGLLETVRRWSADGMTVFGFRPPIAGPILEVEQRCSGFDQEAFVEAFERAGGRWLDLPPTGFQTYDGSHLGRDEARRFSRLLSLQMSMSQTVAARRP